MQQHTGHEDNQKVGIREFRDNLSRYVEGTSPIAITKHGETVGYYIPTKRRATQADMEALAIASAKVQEMLAKAGVTEDEIIEDFKRLRRGDQDS